MKKILLIVLSTVICFSGCVSQSEYDSLNSQLSELQNEVSDCQQSISDKDIIISEKENKISELEKNIKMLESDNEKLNNDNNALLEKIDELENGASRLLSDINNAYESKDYSKVINLANELHKKFNGSEEDTKAQTIAKQAQAEIDKIEAEKKAEEERKAAEAAKSKQEKAREKLRIYKAEIYDIDSAGGCDVTIAWENKSEQTIKYITFTVGAINAVGDNVRCEITNDMYCRLKCTGPYKKNEGEYSYSDYFNTYYGACWGSVWYNYTAETVEITEIEIEYMDGTKTTLNKEDIQYIIY